MSEIKKHTVVGLAALLAGAVAGALFLQRLRNRSRVALPAQEESNARIPIDQLLKEYSDQFNSSRVMERIVPRQFTEESQLVDLTSSLYYSNKSSHLISLTKALSDPIWDLLDRGGKRWRPILCMLIAEAYGRKREEVFEIAALCEIIHNGTLLVDDIEDDSKVRRNKECVHLLFGVDISINAGNFMYFAPLHYLLKQMKLSPKQQIEMSRIYLEEMTSLHIGQGWDILWHNTDRLEGKFPNENHYLQMTAHKTGVLARLSCKLVCVYLGIDNPLRETLSKLAETMGVAFQIQDDLLNLEGEEYKKTKGFLGEDIHEGKLSLMVIHALNNSENSARLLEILRKKTEDQGEINEAIQILKQAGSLEYARMTMHRLIDGAWREAEASLPENKYKVYLRELAYFNISRKV